MITQIYTLEEFKNQTEAYAEFIEDFPEAIDYSFNDIIDYLNDFSEEYDFDNNYLNYYASIETNNFRFELQSSQYRKDGGLCDIEVDDFFTITDLKLEREEETKKKLEKQEKKNKQKEVDRNKWKELFTNKTKEEILDLLINTKYTLK